MTPVPLFAVLLCVVAFCGACSDAPAERPMVVREVEISPGKFIEIRGRSRSGIVLGRRDDHTWMEIPYGGVTIKWDAPDAPVILREHGGRLYLAGADRTTHSGKGYDKWVTEYHFYRQD